MEGPLMQCSLVSPDIYLPKISYRRDVDDISLLVKLVTSGNDAQKGEAAGALWEVSFSDAKLEKIDLAMEMLLASGSDAQIENAAGALLNLSVNVANQNTIALLVELLRSANNRQQQYAARALWNLAFENTEFRDFIVAQSGAVDQLVNLASKGTKRERELAARVLEFLASHLPSGVKMKIATQGGIEALMLWIARPENAKWIHEGLTALQGLCTDGNDTIRAIVKKLDERVTLSSIRESRNERNKMLADQILEWLEGTYEALRDAPAHG